MAMNPDTNPTRKYVYYRPPVLKKYAHEWRVEYWFRVPDELRHVYKKEWKRFSVYENINRIRTDEYATLLRDAVERALELGYNPFTEEAKRFHSGPAPAPLTLKRGLELYLENEAGKGLAEKTMGRYREVCRRILEYFVSKNLHGLAPSEVKKAHLETMLKQYKKERNWSNRQFNNIRSYTYTVFEFFRSKEWIDKNPMEHIEGLKTASKKHRYYDKAMFPKFTQILKENDPYLWQAFQFVYYLCVRSSKELRLIKVGDIRDNGETFLFRAEVSKADRDDYIPIHGHLKEVMQQMGLLEAPPDYFIFTIAQKPGPVPIGENYFNKRFQKVRRLAGLSNDYTLYGAKHTRSVHLLLDGLKLADLSRFLRHRDVATTAKYLRDLGVDFDAAEWQAKTRKI